MTAIDNRGAGRSPLQEGPLGTVAQIVEEALAFPHKPSAEAIERTLDAFVAHQSADRLHDIAVPTLVLSGDEDAVTPPRYGRIVADGN